MPFNYQNYNKKYRLINKIFVKNKLKNVLKFKKNILFYNILLRKMAEKITPNLYTQRGFNKVRQYIYFEKLNVIRNMIIDRSSIKQIQRAIGIKKIAANK